MPTSPRAKAQLRHAVVTVLLVAALLALVNVLAWRTNPSIDLTTNHRFSVSPGTLKGIDSMPWPVSATYYVSRERPPIHASLRRDVIAKLSAIASEGGAGKFLFDAAKDVSDVANDGTEEGRLAALGVRPQSTTSAAGTLRWFSAVRLESVGAREPVVIQADSPERLEYDLISQLLRMRLFRPVPPSAEARFAAIPGKLNITYTIGVPPTEFDSSGAPPPALAHLPGEVQSIFDRIKAVNPKIETVIDADPKSPLRGGPTVAGGCWSHFTLTHGGLRTTRIDAITDMQGVFGLLASTAWELTLPRRKVGVLSVGAGPTARPELVDTERRRVYQLGSPEARIQWLLGQLGHEAIEVQVGPNFSIPTEIAALVIPRPSGLSALERYEIEAYLAAGGNVLLFHGEWHLPLLDAGLSYNQRATGITELFFAGEPTGTLSLRAVPGTLSEYLSSLGVDTGAGILVAGAGSLPARVVGPSRRTTQSHLAEPSIYASREGLAPAAQVEASGSGLARDASGLPLRASSPLIVDDQKLQASGLSAETLLLSPPDAKLLVPTDSRANHVLVYAGGDGDWLPAALNNGRASATLDAGSLPVAIHLRGQFPFDPTVAPPTPKGSQVVLTPPGSRFQKSPGQLVIVSSPNCIEYADTTGTDIFGINSGALVGDAWRSAEGALRRLTANVVDSFVYGTELVEVRQSLLPTPRKVLPWTEGERTLWLALNLCLAPILAMIVWTMFAIRRRASRTVA